MEGSFSRSRSKKASIVKPFERWVSGSVDWGRGEVEENYPGRAAPGGDVEGGGQFKEGTEK